MQDPWPGPVNGVKEIVEILGKGSVVFLLSLSSCCNLPSQVLQCWLVRHAGLPAAV